MEPQDEIREIPLNQMDLEHTSSLARSQLEIPNSGTSTTKENFTRGTYFRVGSAGLSFLCAGINDGSLGSLIPYIIRTYQISTNLVSVVYATTFAGWLLTALINSHVCQYLNLGALLALGAVLQLFAQILRAWLPPFGLYAVTFFLQSLGMAFQDTHSNTYVTSVKRSHRWLGFIHAMYALGCAIGPFIATAIASADTPSRWNLFYTFPAVLGTVNLLLVIIAFRDTVSLKSSQSARTSVNDVLNEGSRSSNALAEIRATLRIPAVWLLSLFFFFFLGSAITAGGWVVEYLVEVRGGKLDEVGYVAGGFWFGMFAGRLLLAEPIKRFGEKRSIFACAVLCLALELLFWLVPNIVAGAVAISFFGFFSGPFFATGVSVASQLFDASIKSSALALIFVLGQIGGSLFPALIGIIAAKFGVAVLQPMVVGLCSATAMSWLLVPKPLMHRD